MPEIALRPGRKEDVTEIHQLILELARFEKAEHEVETTLEELLEDGFSKNPIFKVIVAETNNKIVGIALFYTKYSTWKGKCVYLEDLIVKEDFRGRGIGKMLFDSIANEAKKVKAKRMEWQVLNWNEAGINFYKKYNSVLDDTWINCKLTDHQIQKF